MFKYAHKFLFQTGIFVCIGATGFAHCENHEEAFALWHAAVVSRQAKQNSTLHLGHSMFLHAWPECSIFLPQVGHALMLGMSGKLA